MWISWAKIVVMSEMAVVICLATDLADVVFGVVDGLEVLGIDGRKAALDVVDGCPDCGCAVLVLHDAKEEVQGLALEFVVQRHDERYPVLVYESEIQFRCCGSVCAV